MAKQDPIGDLFSPVESKQVQPARSTVVSQPSGQGWMNALVALLVVVLIGSYVIRMGGCDRKQDQEQQEKDDQDHKHDQKKDDDKKQVAIKAGYLIVVRERQDASIEIEEQVAAVKAFCQSQSDQLEFRDVDDDDTSDAIRKLVSHAKGKGVDPPCVVFKSRDNELLGVIKLPTNESELMGVFAK